MKTCGIEKSNPDEKNTTDETISICGLNFGSFNPVLVQEHLFIEPVKTFCIGLVILRNFILSILPKPLTDNHFFYYKYQGEVSLKHSLTCVNTCISEQNLHKDTL